MTSEDERIEKKYEKAFSQLGEVQTVFPTNTKIDIAKIVEELARNELNIFKSGTESAHYQHMSPAVKDFYQKQGFDIDLEPHGSRGPDVVGINMKGDLRIGEIKHKGETRGHWSQWNSERSMSGKSSDFKLKTRYSDQGASLTPEGKDWAATIDGQLHKDCKIYGVKKGALHVENFNKFEDSIRETLQYLKKEGRIESFTIKTDSRGNGHIDISFKGIKKDNSVSSIQDEIRDKIRLGQDEAIIDNMKKAAIGAAAISAITSGVYNTEKEKGDVGE